MHRQEGTKHAMPVLYDTAGPHGLIPGGEQGCRTLLPLVWQAYKQLAGLGTKQCSTLPCPADQRHGLWPQALASLLLDRIERLSKTQQMWESQLHMMPQLFQRVLHRSGSHLPEFF